MKQVPAILGHHHRNQLSGLVGYPIGRDPLPAELPIGKFTKFKTMEFYESTEWHCYLGIYPEPDVVVRSKHLIDSLRGVKRCKYEEDARLQGCTKTSSHVTGRMCTVMRAFQFAVLPVKGRVGFDPDSARSFFFLFIYFSLRSANRTESFYELLNESVADYRVLFAQHRIWYAQSVGCQPRNV